MWVSNKKWRSLERRVLLVEEKLISRRYEVKEGDTLVSISLFEYGTKEGYKAIAEVNELDFNRILYPGQILWIPPKESLKFVGFQK